DIDLILITVPFLPWHGIAHQTGLFDLPHHLVVTELHNRADPRIDEPGVHRISRDLAKLDSRQRPPLFRRIQRAGCRTAPDRDRLSVRPGDVIFVECCPDMAITLARHENTIRYEEAVWPVIRPCQSRN